MKTKLEILSKRIGTYGFTDLELNKPIICPIEAIESMQEYADQQTKEKDLRIIDLEDKLKIINDSYLLDSVHSLNRNKELREEIERLKSKITVFRLKDFNAEDFDC